jgi:hypothetical protein
MVLTGGQQQALPVGAWQLIEWREGGPVAAPIAGTLPVDWGNPLTWDRSPVLVFGVMRLADFTLLALPGFFAWLILEFMEFYSEGISDGPARPVHPDHI